MAIVVTIDLGNVDTSKVAPCTCSPDDGSFTCPREDECFDNWLIGVRVVTFLARWGGRQRPEVGVTCGYCGTPPEYHGDSDAGPMTVCPSRVF